MIKRIWKRIEEKKYHTLLFKQKDFFTSKTTPLNVEFFQVRKLQFFKWKIAQARKFLTKSSRRELYCNGHRWFNWMSERFGYIRSYTFIIYCNILDPKVSVAFDNIILINTPSLKYKRIIHTSCHRNTKIYFWILIIWIQRK